MRDSIGAKMDINEMGLDTFCETQASLMTDDKDKQILIKEGLRALYQNRLNAAALPINQTTSYRFFGEVSPSGTMILWDFYTISLYMAGAAFYPDGCRVENARTGSILTLSPKVSQGFHDYLVQCVPGFEEIAQSLRAKFSWENRPED